MPSNFDRASKIVRGLDESFNGYVSKIRGTPEKVVEKVKPVRNKSVAKAVVKGAISGTTGMLESGSGLLGAGGEILGHIGNGVTQIGRAVRSGLGPAGNTVGEKVWGATVKTGVVGGAIATGLSLSGGMNSLVSRYYVSPTYRNQVRNQVIKNERPFETLSAEDKAMLNKTASLGSMVGGAVGPALTFAFIPGDKKAIAGKLSATKLTNGGRPLPSNLNPAEKMNSFTNSGSNNFF